MGLNRVLLLWGVKSRGIVAYFAALKAGVDCRNCLEIPVMRCIAVGLDEEYDLEAVGDGGDDWDYSYDFDSSGGESKETPVRPSPFLKKEEKKI